jgi:hypothetical protein
MKNYLEGYLDVLPQGQQSKVQDVLKATKGSIDAGVITEAEFKELVRRIAEDHEQLTTYLPQVEKVDDVLHNAFFSKVSTDINLMYAESQLIERALGSYDRLYDGILSDLSKEIKSLAEKIGSLRLVAEGENGLIVKTYDFGNNSAIETDRVKYAHLFKDRDGSDIPDVVIERTGDVSYIGLAKSMNQDHLRDSLGNTTATLNKIDYRGVPIPQTAYPVGNAIDSSTDSYWGEVVLVDDVVNVGMDGLAAGGAMVKFTVTLARPEVVSEISLTPFSNFPIEITSVKYEEDIETYHVPKEILSKPIEGIQTMVMQFPSILAKRFTFILRQQNYVKDTYIVRAAAVSKNELWEKISNREVEVTLASPSATATVDQSALDSYSGWDIYLSELSKYEDDHAKYVSALQEYIQKKAKWDQEVNTYESEYSSYLATIQSLNATYGRYGANYTASQKLTGEYKNPTI